MRPFYGTACPCPACGRCACPSVPVHAARAHPGATTLLCACPREGAGEPRLDARDVETWDMWMRAAAVHAQTQAFGRHVDVAKRIVEEAIRRARAAGLPDGFCLSISGGKDSTDMWHLAAVEMGVPCVAVSEKDDLDFPGEEAYLRALAALWGVRLEVVHPPVSPAAFIASLAAAGQLHAGDDIHARAAALSKTCFYDVIEPAVAGYAVVALGLRAEESGIRRHVLASKGAVYELRGKRKGGAPAQFRCNPLARWTALDVYAYAVSRGFDQLHVYRCIGFMHRDEPGRLRKSWWLPGSSSARGQVAWLHRYYPALYRQMVAWMPHATTLR